MRRIALTSLALAVFGCTPHHDSLPGTPKSGADAPAEEPQLPEQAEPKPVPIQVAVASAQLYEDCPAAPGEPAKAEPAGQVDDEHPGESARPFLEGARGKTAPPIPGMVGSLYPPPCTQSWLQLTFSSAAAGPVDVEIKRVQVVTGGTRLGAKLQTRSPSVWDSTHGYLPWDEVVLPGESKASYKLGAQKGASIRAIAAEQLFYFVEVEISVGGELQTIRSPEVSPAAPHDIVT